MFYNNANSNDGYGWCYIIMIIVMMVVINGFCLLALLLL